MFQLTSSIKMAAVAATEQINLHWKDFASTVSTSFQWLRNNHDLFDVTLACYANDNQTFFIKAHKVILAASSPVLRQMMVNLEGSSNAMLYLSGIEEYYVKCIVDFLYTGEVNVARDKLERFLQVAEELKVEGLIRNEKAKEEASEDSPEKLIKARKRSREEKVQEENDDAKKNMNVKNENLEQNEEEDIVQGDGDFDDDENPGPEQVEKKSKFGSVTGDAELPSKGRLIVFTNIHSNK